MTVVVNDPGGAQLMDGVLEGISNLILGAELDDVLLVLVWTDFFAAFA